MSVLSVSCEAGGSCSAVWWWEREQQLYKLMTSTLNFNVFKLVCVTRPDWFASKSQWKTVTSHLPFYIQPPDAPVFFPPFSASWLSPPTHTPVHSFCHISQSQSFSCLLIVPATWLRVHGSDFTFLPVPSIKLFKCFICFTAARDKHNNPREAFITNQTLCWIYSTRC